VIADGSTVDTAPVQEGNGGVTVDTLLRWLTAEATEFRVISAAAPGRRLHLQDTMDLASHKVT